MISNSLLKLNKQPDALWSKDTHGVTKLDMNLNQRHTQSTLQSQQIYAGITRQASQRHKSSFVANLSTCAATLATR